MVQNTIFIVSKQQPIVYPNSLFHLLFIHFPYLFVILLLPILLPIIHRDQLPDPIPSDHASYQMVQLRILLFPAAVSVSVYVADGIEYEVQVRIFRILMHREGDLIFRADLVADSHAYTI